MGKNYVIGDIHGQCDAMLEVFEMCKFDYKKDTLIILGDIVDGGKKTKQAVDKLLKINQKNVAFVRGNHDCLDTKTELLTRNGWKTYDKIDKDTDIIFSYDYKTNTGVWSKINDVIVRDHVGDMISLRCKNADMCMTPNHRVLRKRLIYYKNADNKYEYKPTEYGYELAKDLWGEYEIKTSTQQKCNEFNITDDMLKLFGWLLTDSHVCKHGYWTIYQSKQDNVKSIRNLLCRMNINFTERVCIPTTKEICGVKLKKKPLVSYEFRIKAKSSKKIILKSKTIPKWMMLLSRRQFKVLLSTIVKGDGSKATSGDSVVIYKNESFLDDLQTLCIINNFRACKSKTAGYYRLYIIDKTTCTFSSWDRNRKKMLQIEKGYNDKVWCLNVPLSNFMVRRNGKTYFTGNCWFLGFIKYRRREDVWYKQGGKNTLDSYRVKGKITIPPEHIDFFRNSCTYCIKDKRLFVHGGFDPKKGISHTKTFDILWDRALIEYARTKIIKGYDRVFVGHTTTQSYGYLSEIQDCMRPIFFNNLVMMDCGAGWNGRLSIMNIDTLEHFESSIQTSGR